jgi:hypothetical protein
MYHQLSSTIFKYHQLSSTIFHYHQLYCTIINYLQLSWIIINYLQLPTSIINYHQLSSTIIVYHQLWSTIINYHQLTSTIFNYHQLYLTTINYLQLYSTITSYQQLSLTTNNYLQLYSTIINSGVQSMKQLHLPRQPWSDHILRRGLQTRGHGDGSDGATDRAQEKETTGARSQQAMPTHFELGSEIFWAFTALHFGRFIEGASSQLTFNHHWHSLTIINHRWPSTFHVQWGPQTFRLLRSSEVSFTEAVFCPRPFKTWEMMHPNSTKMHLQHLTSVLIHFRLCAACSLYLSSENAMQGRKPTAWSCWWT